MSHYQQDNCRTNCVKSCYINLVIGPLSIHQVDRHQLAVHKSELGPRYMKDVNTDPLFYSRQYGLLHICFPDLVPNGL